MKAILPLPLTSFSRSCVASAGVDPPAAPQLLGQQFEPCSCAAAMQETFLACHDAYQLLPVSSCEAPDGAVQRHAAQHMQRIISAHTWLAFQGTHRMICQGGRPVLRYDARLGCSWAVAALRAQSIMPHRCGILAAHDVICVPVTQVHSVHSKRQRHRMQQWGMQCMERLRAAQEQRPQHVHRTVPCLQPVPPGHLPRHDGPLLCISSLEVWLFSHGSWAFCGSIARPLDMWIVQRSTFPIPWALWSFVCSIETTTCARNAV